MLKKYCQRYERDWDDGVNFVLFAVREAVRESLGFSLYELIFGHSIRGPLLFLKEKWLKNEKSQHNLLDYVSDFKERLLNMTKKLKLDISNPVIMFCYFFQSQINLFRLNTLALMKEKRK